MCSCQRRKKLDNYFLTESRKNFNYTTYRIRSHFPFSFRSLLSHAEKIVCLYDKLNYKDETQRPHARLRAIFPNNFAPSLARHFTVNHARVLGHKGSRVGVERFPHGTMKNVWPVSKTTLQYRWPKKINLNSTHRPRLVSLYFLYVSSKFPWLTSQTSWESPPTIYYLLYLAFPFSVSGD